MGGLLRRAALHVTAGLSTVAGVACTAACLWVCLDQELLRFQAMQQSTAPWLEELLRC